MNRKSNPIKIVTLAERPGAVPLVAQWFYDEWNSYDGRPLSMVETQLRQNLNQTIWPITFLALHNDKAVGTISLDHEDLPSHDSRYSPWLASLYILPTYRHQGIGKLLIGHLLKFARTQKLSHLYLWTSGPTELYEKCGWSILEQTEYDGRPITVRSGNRLRRASTA